MASATTQIASSSSTSSSIGPGKYEVFISFHGKDTRLGFTASLHDALERRGIIVFSDNELKPQRYVHEELFKAIEESLYAVVVISENYASSPWCLWELTRIMERMKENRLRVFPVLYNVDPSDVRDLRGSFKTAFDYLRELGNSESLLDGLAAPLQEVGNCIVDPPERETQEANFAEASASSRDDTEGEEEPCKPWRVVLMEKGQLAGWHVNKRSEQTFVEEISATISGCLMRSLPEVPKFLVEMDSPVMEMWRLLDLRSHDVRFVGICGISGIGKTTLARVIYERASFQFKEKCFIARIGEATGRDIVGLQKYLISMILTKSVANMLNNFDDVYKGIKLLRDKLHKIRVFVVLDDVCRKEQIEALAGSLEWFGNGSRIILTSRDHYLSTYFCKDNVYKVEALKYKPALELFRSKAFKKRHPEEKLERLVKDIVESAEGLPLALKVFGSCLCDAKASIWESYLIQLKANSSLDVGEKLRIIFEGLGNLEQKTFLDILCILSRESKYRTPSIKCSTDVLKDLEHKSLINFGESGELIIHDLLIQMGQKVAKHSRLWLFEDIASVLSRERASEAIRVILLKFPRQEPEILCYDAFSSMKKLRVLEIRIPEGLIWSNKWKGFIELKWCGNFSKLSLSNKLRVLIWDQCPLEFLPPSFNPANLVALELRQSSLKALWTGIKMFHKLTRIDLHGSKELTEMPDLREIPHLEHLDLSNCSKLSSVHHSIGHLQRLRELSLRNCFRLEHLPNTFNLPSLTSLDLCGCTRRKKFPGGVRNLTSLRTLNLSNTAIKKLPSSFTSLAFLTYLYVSGLYFSEEMMFDNSSGSINDPETRYRPSGVLTDARRSVNLRNWSSGLSSLEKLDLSYRNLKSEKLPKSFGFFSSLTYLNLSGNKFEKISDSVRQLCKLRHLLLNNCVNLESLPMFPLGMRDLDLGNCPMLKRFYIDLNRWCSPETSRPCDWISAYFGYNGESYNFLNLHPESAVWINKRGHSERWVAWGRSSVSEIPVWFNHRSTSSLGQIVIPANWHYDMWPLKGYALFIVYEVSNPDADLSFDCLLKAHKDVLGFHLRFFIRERPLAGRNGVWIYIPFLWVEKDLDGFGNVSSSSIEITSETVEVKECGSKLVGAAKAQFLEIVRGISPHDLDVKSLGDKFLSGRPYSIDVHGPIKKSSDTTASKESPDQSSPAPAELSPVTEAGAVHSTCSGSPPHVSVRGPVEHKSTPSSAKRTPVERSSDASASNRDSLDQSSRVTDATSLGQSQPCPAPAELAPLYPSPHFSNVNQLNYKSALLKNVPKRK